MNEIKLFENPEFGEVRVVEKNGDPWFVAADICRALDLQNTAMAISRLDDDEKGVSLTDTPGGTQTLSLVNEPGLYSLVLGSRKPEAKAFKRWITHEVIPSIRKTGGYIQGQESMTPEQIVANALIVANNIIAEKERQIALAEEQMRLMAPKAQYFDALVDSSLLTNFRDTAKELGIGQKELIDFCIDEGYCYRTSSGKVRPYTKYNGGGNLFLIKDVYDNASGRSWPQTFLTPRGKETIRLTYNAAHGRMPIV